MSRDREEIPCRVELVDVEVDDDDADDGSGRTIPGVCATCSQCGAEETSYGTSSKSIRRCLVMLRENCEEDEDGQNFYVNDGKDYEPDDEE